MLYLVLKSKILKKDITDANYIPGHAVPDCRQVAGRLGREEEVLRRLAGPPAEGVSQRDWAGGPAGAAVGGGGRVAQRGDGHVVEEVVVVEEVGGGSCIGILVAFVGLLLIEVVFVLGSNSSYKPYLMHGE